MEIIKLKITEIKPYDKNPRKNDGAVDAVAESIKQCGYCAPIVIDEDNVILAGHTRLKALKKLKYKECECVRKVGMTEEQKRKYRLLDNKTNELAEWDIDLLKGELEGLDFLDFDFGFDIADESEPQAIVEDDAPEVDNQAEPITKLGDIWQLGRHRLMCGDSTNAQNIALLMDGKKLDRRNRRGHRGDQQKTRERYGAICNGWRTARQRPIQSGREREYLRIQESTGDRKTR